MKYQYSIWCFLLSICFLFTNCQKETLVSSFLTIDEESLVQLKQPFLKEYGSKTVPLQTNLDVVKVYSSVDWCAVSILEDYGIQLRVEVLPNEGFSERTCEITVFGKDLEEIKIPIVQWSDEPKMHVDEIDGVQIIDGDLEFTLHITSNVDFEFELPVWVTSVGDNSPFIGSKLYTFVTSSIMPGERVGYLKVVTDGHTDLDKTVEIAQLQNVLVPELTDFSPTSAEKEETIVLNGVNFGTNKDLVKVYFNIKQADIVSVADNAIEVIVPRAPGSPCAIKVEILGETYTYSTNFDYKKSWGLYTVTGNGTTTFKAGTLAQGQLQARYISLDGNGNIFASHRDEGNNRYVVRINEQENIVQGLGTNMGNTWQPNGTTIGPNNVVYLANDSKNGTSYFELDPANGYTPVERTITYPTGSAPPTSSYMYRLHYSQRDNHLYGFIGHNDGVVIKVNPVNQQGSIIYKINKSQNPTWYASILNPNDRTQLYTVYNNQSLGYGPYLMDITNDATIANGFTRLNPNSTTAGNSGVAGLTDHLSTSGFGLAWDLEFGPDGYLYISDNNNHIIRRINLTTKVIETVVGLAGASGNVDGKKDKARLTNPRGIAWNSDGATMYISDFGNSKIRKWTLD